MVICLGVRWDRLQPSHDLNWIDVKETDEYMGNDRKDSIIKKYKFISVSFSNVFIVRVELLQH